MKNEPKVTGYVVYAGIEREADCKTKVGAARCARRLARLGFAPSVRAYMTDGTMTWLQDVEVTL